MWGGSDVRTAMNTLTDCVQSLHSRWLASSVACCFPRLPDQSEPEPPGTCTISSPLPMHMLIEAKLLMRVVRYAASSLNPFNLFPAKVEIHKRPTPPTTALHNGWQMAGVLLRGRPARQALQAGEPGLGGQLLDRLEHLMILREWSIHEAVEWGTVR